MAHNYCTCWGNRGSCIDCAEEEIDRLTAQLAEARAEIKQLKNNVRLHLIHHEHGCAYLGHADDYEEGVRDE